MPAQWEDKNKPHRNIVFIGHVDHGKSTTVGRLLLDSGHIEGHVIEKNEKLAAEAGKAGFGLAYVMDGLKEERERGITIDVAHKEFFTPNYYWTIIDAPGHRDFVKNMITGASQADTAVLLCAANDGVNAQTKEHAFLAKVLGVKELIVHVNKMDISGVDWSEDKYKACGRSSALLKMAGFKPDDVPMIPASLLNGDNVYNKSTSAPWYKGPTLFEAIDAAPMPSKPLDKPLRLPIQDVYKISGIGTVPVGKIETGTLNVWKDVVFNPSQKSAEVKSIEMHHTMVDKAEPGDNVGFNVRGLAATTSAVVTLLDTLTANQRSFVTTKPSSVKSNLWTFQRLFPSDTPQCSTHTPLKLLSSSKNFLKRPTRLVRKLTLPSSRPVTHV